MSMDKRQKLYNESTIRNPKIKISTTDPKLKDKIHIDLDGDMDKVYWYIKFNMALDPDSVSRKTMCLMETNGYILDTIISYDLMRNMIVICPTDIYLQNQYYLLNVTRKVKSVSGQNLKKEIHIMFKIIGDEITEFEILKSTVKIPKAKPRTKEYRKELERKILEAEGREVNIKGYFEDDRENRLPYGDLEVNFVVAIIGLVVILIGSFLNIYLMAAGFVVCVLGLLHILLQLAGRRRRSMFVYNIGVWFYNMSKYEAAHKRFKKALSIYKYNEMAQEALNKSVLYL